MPAIPQPSAAGADISSYKEAVINGLQDEVESEHAQVIVNNDRNHARDCLGAVGYYVFMDGDTLFYTDREWFEWEGTIGQEYCFNVIAEVPIPDSTTVISSDTTQVTDSDLFFSEYAEGSSYNKYIEIYNGTGADVDLSKYQITQITNGGNWYENIDTLSGTLVHGDVYEIAHTSAVVRIIAEAD